MKIDSGITLIELIISTALLFILGTLSASFYSQFFLQNAVANTQDQLIGELRKAQMYTMMGKQNAGIWGVTINSGKIILFQGNTYATRNTALDERFTLATNVTVAGLTEVEFSRLTGIPTTTPTITITANNTSKTITLNTVGRISR